MQLYILERRVHFYVSLSHSHLPPPPQVPVEQLATRHAVWMTSVRVYLLYATAIHTVPSSMTVVMTSMKSVHQKVRSWKNNTLVCHGVYLASSPS